MRPFRTLACFAAALLAIAMSAAPARADTTKTLKPFASEAEFLALLKALHKDTGIAAAADGTASPPVPVELTPVPSPVVSMPAPAPAGESSQAASAPPPPASMAADSNKSLDTISVSGSLVTGGAPSITNVQTEGVDEGDIVKQQGDYLVVLRRGRLFTLRVGGDKLQPVALVDAFAPGSDPSLTWYDEMLVSRGTVVVIGYSYDRGGTEVGVFDLHDDGRLAYRATYQLRSNDYYSSSNYASRLIGRTLIFYTPLVIGANATPDDFWPAMRRWRNTPTPPEFRRILPATRIYRTAGELDPSDLALHTVTQCDLDAPELDCRSTAVLGASGRVFYVSADSVYVWNTPWDSEGKRNAASIVRIPLEGAAPTALRASGSPIDQMSLLERDGVLNVVVGSEADGEGMWRSKSHAGELALLRVPLSRFGDGTQAARRGDYRQLPADFTTVDDAIHNRFLGDWLLVGGESDRDVSRALPVLAMRYADPAAKVERVPMAHAVERIDALGSGAVAVGSRGSDLVFTSVRLGAHAQPAHTYVQPDAAQGDERTHGYFYHPTGADEGIAGLPILRGGNDEGASVLYLRNRALRLRRLGRLDSRATGRDDACLVSCVDWYGNARPIFLGDRVFALLGYELVEGRLVGERIVERRRVDFGGLIGAKGPKDDAKKPAIAN